MIKEGCLWPHSRSEIEGKPVRITGLSGAFSVSGISLQKHLVADIQRFPQALRHFLADGALAVLHFADMALRYAGQFCP